MSKQATLNRLQQKAKQLDAKALAAYDFSNAKKLYSAIDTANKNNELCRKAIAAGFTEEAYRYGQVAFEAALGLPEKDKDVAIEEWGYVLLAMQGALREDLTMKDYQQSGERWKQNSHQTKTELLHNIYFNLAISISDYNTEKALNYLKQADIYKPNDEEVIFHQWLFNYRKGDFEASIKAAGNINSPIKGLLMLQSEWFCGKIAPEAAKEKANKLYSIAQKKVDKLSPSKKTTYKKKIEQHYLDLIAGIEIKLGNIEAAIVAAKQLVSLQSDIHSVIGKINGVLTHYINKNDFEGGGAYFEEMYERYPALHKAKHNSVLLLYNEFLVYEQTDRYDEATSVLDTLNTQSNTLNLELKKHQDHANNIRFYTDLRKGNNDKAYSKFKSMDPAAIDGLLKLFKTAAPDKGEDKTEAEELEDNALIDAMIEAEINDGASESLSEVEKVEERLESHAAAAIEAGTNNDVLKSLAEVNERPELSAAEDSVDTPLAGKMAEEELEELHFDIKALHRYCQYKKNALAREGINKFKSSTNEHDTSWKLPSGEVYDTRKDNVYKLKGIKNYYIYIDDSLCEKETMQAFIRAIDKGVVKSAVGCNGVKFLNKGFIEIKTSGGPRAWGDTLYRNDKGKFLIIIDEYGNHNAVKRAAKSGKIKIENVSTYTEIFNLQHEKEDYVGKFVVDGHELKDPEIEFLGDADAGSIYAAE